MLKDANNLANAHFNLIKETSSGAGFGNGVGCASVRRVVRARRGRVVRRGRVRAGAAVPDSARVPQDAGREHGRAVEPRAGVQDQGAGGARE